MTGDSRLTPANARVVHADSAADHPGLTPVQGQPMQIAVPVADLRRAPGGPRDRQWLLGADVQLLEDRNGDCFVLGGADGYVGYLRRSDLGPPRPVSHWVAVRATHAYAEPDMKSPDRLSLAFGSRLHVTGHENGFHQTALGYLPARHLARTDVAHRDPLRTAGRFLGTPYLWGGNSAWGIDCSGLVQAALHAAHLPCPGDSDMQQALGHNRLGTAIRRGDLLFWKGHVAIAQGPHRMIHANAHHMAVVSEPIAGAVARIAAAGGGPMIAHRRL
ncbi:MAG: C40 family peptidase [Rhodobacteraceae bacterium]|nr:C40 family peptidase [Paracoccaceae bacterium]